MTITWCAPRLAPILAHVGAVIILIALGVLLLVFVKKLKALTHGAEDETNNVPHDEEAQSVVE